MVVIFFIEFLVSFLKVFDLNWFEVKKVDNYKSIEKGKIDREKNLSKI